MGQLNTPLPPEVLPTTGGKGDRMDSLMDGDFDEHPVHEVEIRKAFYLGVHEVTNFEYELFDPAHAARRGQAGISNADDEPVVFVNWYDAKAFCRWLSDKEGRPYRLPTEAEWEYACRAGTTTHYSAGDVLPRVFHKHQGESKVAHPVPLHVGKTPANAWGFMDLHGNVEEWCEDWYGPYVEGRQVDPVGYSSGQFRVTRGGSHGTQVY